MSYDYPVRLEYDESHWWIIATIQEGPQEFGASAIVAERVRPETGAPLVAVYEAARLVSQWHDSIGSGPIGELNAELGQLGQFVRTVR